MKISANIVVKNEGEYIGQVLTQVLKLADEVFVVDTGSTDNTVEEIKKFSVNFEQITGDAVQNIRNKLLQKSTGNWIWIVDGDEVWPDEMLPRLKELPNKFPDINAFSFSFVHFMPYGIAEHKSRSIRLIRKKPDLRWVGEFPREVFEDDKGKIMSQAGAKILRQDGGDIMFVPDIKFLHYGGVKKNQWRIEQPKKFQLLT